MPKAGRSFADCEDAYFPSDPNNLEVYEAAQDDVEIFRAAVCDGATDSIFSKLWAQLLAQGYGAGKWASDISAQTITDEQNDWHEFLRQQQLPWYAEEKAELGACAALAGLTIMSEPKKWTALALGDCCVFQIRNGTCVLAFPITTSAKFSNFPLLLCSVAERNSDVFSNKHTIPNGTWQSGDQFFLMSDTVACWFLSQIETGNEHVVIPALSSVQTLEAFTALVNEARTAVGADGSVLMRDDDVTVTILSVGDSSLDSSIVKKTNRIDSVSEKSTVDNKITGQAEPRNTAQLPPLPSQNKVSGQPVAELPGAVASTSPGPAAVLATAPGSTAASGSRTGSAIGSVTTPAPKTESTPGLAAPAVQALTPNPPGSPPFVATASGATSDKTLPSKQTFAKSTKQGSTVTRNRIMVASAVIAVSIAALTLNNSFSSHHAQKPIAPKVGSESTQLTPALVKSDAETTKQFGKHHKTRLHKPKKLHQNLSVPEAAAGRVTEPAPDQSSGQNSSQNPASGQTPDRVSGTPATVTPPEPAPDRMPAKAPERTPAPAPDRTRAQAPERTPTQAPERGLEHAPQHALQHEPIATGHRRATSASKGSKSIYHSIDPDRKNKNDLPENLTSKD
jgi:hypothetical protein